jgi:K+-sensing histidine kinase KdpD
MLILTRYDSRMLIPKPHFFKFDELVEECIDSVESLAKSKEVNIKFQIDGKTEVFADRALIKRAIFNLIDNAIKFSKEDNVVSIKLYEFHNDIMFRIYNESDSIDKDKLQDLFRRFHRADLSRSSSGFGLGLAIVQAIIESHESKVMIDAMENGGVTFTFGLRKYESR